MVPEVGVSLPETVQLAHLSNGCPTGRPAQELTECLNGLGPRDSVDGQAGILLEVAQCTRGVRAEDSVDTACVEPETAQTELEVGYVIAPEHRSVQVEVPVPKADPGLHEGGLSGLVHAAVLVEAPFGLKCEERPGGIRAEVAAGHLNGVHRMADGYKTPVEVPDGCALIAGSERF